MHHERQTDEAGLVLAEKATAENISEKSPDSPGVSPDSPGAPHGLESDCESTGGGRRRRKRRREDAPSTQAQRRSFIVNEGSDKLVTPRSTRTDVSENGSGIPATPNSIKDTWQPPWRPDGLLLQRQPSATVSIVTGTPEPPIFLEHKQKGTRDLLSDAKQHKTPLLQTQGAAKHPLQSPGAPASFGGLQGPPTKHPFQSPAGNPKKSFLPALPMPSSGAAKSDLTPKLPFQSPRAPSAAPWNKLPFQSTKVTRPGQQQTGLQVADTGPEPSHSSFTGEEEPTLPDPKRKRIKSGRAAKQVDAPSLSPPSIVFAKTKEKTKFPRDEAKFPRDPPNLLVHSPKSAVQDSYDLGVKVQEFSEPSRVQEAHKDSESSNLKSLFNALNNMRSISDFLKDSDVFADDGAFIPSASVEREAPPQKTAVTALP